MSLAPAAVAIILNSTQDQLLLVKRADIAVFVLPGGGIETGESPEEAVIREVREETGWKVIVKRKSAEYYPINRLAADTHVFICEIVGGAQSISIESREVNFYPLNKLPSTFLYIHKMWIQEALNQTALVVRPLTEVNYGALILFFIYHPWIVLRFIWTRFIKL